MEQQYIVLVAYGSNFEGLKERKNQSEAPACSPLYARAQKAPKNLMSTNDNNYHQKGQRQRR